MVQLEILAKIIVCSGIVVAFASLGANIIYFNILGK
jgi:hypothetical protein